MSNEQLCRLCANLKLPLVDLDCCSSDGISLFELVQSYLTIKLEVLDGFPSVICIECNEQLLLFHQFAVQVHKAQKKFEKLLNSEENTEFCKNNENAAEIIEISVMQNIKEEIVDDSSNNGNISYEFDELESEVKLNECSERSKRLKARIKKQCTDEYDSDEVLATLQSHQIIESSSGLHFRKIKKTIKRRRSSCNNEVLPEPNPYECYICNENSFKSQTELCQHQEIHLLKDSEKKWPCTYCDKRFKFRHMAQNHVRAIHEGKMDYICHLCGKAYSTFGNLGDHLHTHQTVATWECKLCDKKFKRKAALKRHRKVHSGKRVKCPKCGLSLSGERTLRNHMLVHDEVGREKCHICDKRFKLKKTLKVHLITHTGEQPYQCLWCPKTFANNSNCRIHKKRVHKVELMKYEAERDAKSNE